METFLGIDPGVTGAAALIDSENNVIELVDFSDGPTTAKQMDWLRIAYDIKLAGLEKVGSSPMQGRKSIDTFCTNKGWWQGYLDANRITWREVTPAQWQARLVPKKKNSNDRPQLLVVRRMYPHAELHLKKHHDRASALLIAFYLMRFYKNDMKI